MGTTVEEVIVQLDARFEKYERDLARATTGTERRLTAIEAASGRMGRGVSSAFNVAKGAALGFFATAAAGALTRAIREGLEYASSLGEQAQQLGVTTDALQEYRFAASQTGIEAGEMDQALAQLTRRIGEGLSGTKAQAEAFEQLGISLRDSSGEALKAEDAIPLIAEAMGKLGSDAERSAIGTDLFGRSFQKLLPLLAEGRAGIQAYRNEAQRDGLVMTPEQIRQADLAADTLDKFNRRISVRISGAVADNAGSILQLAEALGTLAEYAIDGAAAYGRFASVIERRVTNTMTYSPFASDRAEGQRRLRALNQEEFGGQPIRETMTPAQAAARRARIAPPTRNLGRIAPAPAYLTPGAGRQPYQRGGGPVRYFNDDLSDPVLNGAPALALLGAAAAALAGTPEQALRMAQTIEAFANEVAALTADVDLEAAGDDIAAQAAARQQRVTADRDAANIAVLARDDLDRAQKSELVALNNRLAAVRRDAIAREATAATAEQQARDVEQATRREVDSLRDQADTLASGRDLALSRRDRLDIDRRILDIEEDIERKTLDAAIAAGDIADAAKARADLAKRFANQRDAANRQNTSPIGQYLNQLNEDAANVDDRIESIVTGSLRDLSAGIGEAVVNGKSFGDIFENAGKRAVAALIDLAFQLLVIKPLIESLSGSVGGGGGFLGSFGNALGGLFGGGRATGGPISPGQMYKVGENGPEYISTNRPSFVTPNTQLPRIAGASGMNGGTSTIRLELSGDIDAKIMSTSAGVAFEVVKLVRPGIVDEAARTTLLAAQRPTLG